MLGHSRNGRNVPLCSLELPAKNIFFGSNFEKVSVLLCQGILDFADETFAVLRIRMGYPPESLPPSYPLELMADLISFK